MKISTSGGTLVLFYSGSGWSTTINTMIVEFRAEKNNLEP